VSSSTTLLREFFLSASLLLESIPCAEKLLRGPRSQASFSIGNQTAELKIFVPAPE
jgi:hypothetical protein